MKASGCRGFTFLFFNVLFWLIGAGVGGYAVWILMTTGNINNFLSGTLIFTYSFVGIGAFIIITGVIGCIGGCAESRCILKLYVGLMTVLLIIDASVAIAGYAQRDDVFDLMDDLWIEVNSETKDHIQTQLRCCGYSNFTEEYGENLEDLPSSCFRLSSNDTTLYERPCEEAMTEWVETNIIIWASMIGFVGLIQIIATIFSCLVVKKVARRMRVSDG